MIEVAGRVFQLTTARTSYWFAVSDHGHLVQLHYGTRLPADQAVGAVGLKRTAEIGGAIVYDAADPLYCLDQLCLEWSGVGRGDYRYSPIALAGSESVVTDFTYQSHQVHAGGMDSVHLPGAAVADDQGQTLSLVLADPVAGLELTLDYTVMPAVDVLCRRATLRNTGDQPVVLRRLASLLLDLPNRDFRVLSLHGGWIREAQPQDHPLAFGQFVNSSTTGASSHRHNPGFLLAEAGATETSGQVYGVNLVYSGNHQSVIERSELDLVRISCGINPEGFEWILAPGDQFETPQAVLTCSLAGLGQASRNFHDFVNQHIVRGDWRGRARPVVYNNWEATFFDFTADKLIRLAKQAKDLGAELFVLDDGWFGRRDSDSAGLGDYSVNRRKFPAGLAKFADKVRGLGLDFGIWVEPEMVNPDSDLYRAHPDWAITTPGRTPTLGRHQLVLDLTRAEVRDYVVDQVGRILDTTGAVYVKWDFNRVLADTYSPDLVTPGEFAHRYVLGLYDVLGRLFWSRPQVLLESCASGGNRFDLGMLCYSPQIWTSDNTDPVERLRIQTGCSWLYPPSAMGAHVSQAPHQQTLRDTPLTTRFNVAAFGVLGYELDPTELSRVERAEIRGQVEFYKAHRETLQYGRHYRGDRGTAAKPNKVVWTMVARDGAEAITGLFQTQTEAAESFDRLVVDGLDPSARYEITTRGQSVFLSRFGGLVKHILPVHLNPHGAVLGAARRLWRLTDAVETYQATGALLADGLLLANQFTGTGYNPQTRLLADAGSQLYLTTRG